MRTLGIIASLLMLGWNSLAQTSDHEASLATIQEYYEAGKYKLAGQTLDSIFEYRSPRTAELQLAMRAWASAGVPERALAVLSMGINSGWLSLENVLTDSLLRPLHPTKTWQMEIQRLIRLTNGSDEELRQRLIKLADRDQFYRRQMQDIARDRGWQDPTIKEMYGLQRDLDALNVKEIIEIIDFHGFPGRSVVGNQANTALTILQRADLETQLKYLPQLEEAAAKNEVLRSELAFMIDQIKLAQDLPQVYGTQIIRSSNGGLEFYRVEQPEMINKRRREADLLPIEVYAAKVRVEWLW